MVMQCDASLIHICLFPQDIQMRAEHIQADYAYAHDLMYAQM